MSAPFRRRPASARHAGASGCPRLALRYARNLHGATGRGLPEVAALVRWMSTHAASLGLPDAEVSDEESSGPARGRGVGAEDWRKIGRLLRNAEARAPGQEDGIAAGWLRALAAALDLDPAETAIAELALHYRLDRRIERLFDAVSECRNGAHRFHRDTGLIAFLVGAFPAEVEARLMPDARLLASGLLYVEQDGDIQVLDRITSLIRRGIAATRDLRDQLPALPQFAWIMP